MKRTKQMIATLLVALLLVVSLPLAVPLPTASAATNPYPTIQYVGGVATLPCTYYAWQQAYDRLGIALPGWGNAIDWYNRAANAGYSVGSTPRANSIAVWSMEPWHSFGHVAFVTAVNGSNMTINESGRTDHPETNGVVNGEVVPSTVGSTWSYDSRYLIGFIYLSASSPTCSNAWIKASKSSLFLGESISFTFGANEANSYDITIKHLDTIIKTQNNVKSGVSYTFDKEGTYTAYITAKNGSSSINSSTISFYIVDVIDMGSYFVAKLNNPVSGFYVASINSSTTTNPNVYLSSVAANNNNEWKFTRQKDCTYTIVNVKTGYYLTLQNGKTEDGTNICCAPNNNSDAQKWYIRKNISGYAFVPKLKSSSVLSITGNNSIYDNCIFDGANISLYSNDSVQSQRFIFEYSIPPVEEWLKIDKTILTSSEKLKFEFNSGYAKEHKLHIDYADGTVLEKSIRSGEGVSFEKSGKHSAYIIHIFEDGTEVNTDVVNFYNMKIYDFGKSFYAKIKNTTSGFYVVAKDVAGNYSDVVIASEKYNSNNLWKFDQQANGSYKITNVATGYVLDLYDGVVKDKTNIICTLNNNSDTQRWFITKNVDGYAFAPEKDYTKYVSVFENDTIYWYGEHKDGANVVLYDLDNVQSQRFEFSEFKQICEHRYGEYVYNNDATTQKDGTKTRTCSLCGDTETVTATGTKLQAKNPFTDVKKSDFYYEPVLWAVSNGITSGTSKTTFAPNEACTRGQIATFLWRAAGQPTPKTSKNPFTDVKKSDYYYKAVLWAVGEGITSGTSKTTFGPNEACTRGQIATFLWRANGGKKVNASNPFKDVKKSDYYYNAVLWAVKNKITSGTSATTFSPNEACTRGQIATFLYRNYN